MFVLVATRFAQMGSRHRAGLYLLRFLSGAKQKNSWVTSEQAGDASPDGMQRLLNLSSGDADAVGDDLRGYVLNRLGDSSGVMVADETAFPKRESRPLVCNANTLRRPGRSTIVRPGCV